MPIGLYRQPDICGDEIVFICGEALWIVDKQGGTAAPLPSEDVPGATVSFPRFSPDGTLVVFSATWAGSEDLWVLDRDRGKLDRLTTHPAGDRIVDWFPSGDALLFSSDRESVFSSQYRQFYKLSIARSEDGVRTTAIEKLELPYGEFGAIAPDGGSLVFQPMTTDFQVWSSYRGGQAPDLFRCSLLSDGQVEDIETVTDRQSNDSHPMWASADRLIFLSDWYQSDQTQAPRANLFTRRLPDGRWARLTTSDVDIRFPSIGRREADLVDIVYEADGAIHRVAVRDGRVEESAEVEIRLPENAFTLEPRQRKIAGRLRHPTLTGGGEHVVFESFGSLWKVDPSNRWTPLVDRAGVAARYPSITADGRWLAYHEDAPPETTTHREYDLVIRDLHDETEERFAFPDATDVGFRYRPNWSPDGRFLAFVDNRHDLWLLDRQGQGPQRIGRAEGTEHHQLERFALVFDRDSRFLIYASETENRNGALFLYAIDRDSVEADHRGRTFQLTSDELNDTEPCLSACGERLYFISRRRFNLIQGEIGYSWVYANTKCVCYLPIDAIEAALTNAGGTSRALYHRLDAEVVEVDAIPPGQIWRLLAVDGGLAVYRVSNQGVEVSEFRKWVAFYDRERDEVVGSLACDVHAVHSAPDHSRLLIRRDDGYHLLEPRPCAKLVPIEADDPVQEVTQPRDEWRQLFHEAWRHVRDYFYVEDAAEYTWLEDWQGALDRFAPLVARVRTRRELNDLIGSMYSQLASSHTNISGGDGVVSPRREDASFLGADLRWRADCLVIERLLLGSGGEYREAFQSPLAFPEHGEPAEEGDVILEINGRAPSRERPLWHELASEQGELATLQLRKRDGSSSTLRVRTVSWAQQQMLRQMAWIADHRRWVDRLSGGLVGYVAIPSTGSDGQAFFTRQYQSQFHKEGLIFDARFCLGGYYPDDLVELVARPRTAHYPSRHTQFSNESPLSRTGVQAMLINAWSGSAGDLLPYLFERLKLGQVIGTRSWGGVVSSQGVPDLVDGGWPRIPNQAFVDPLRKTKIENRGYSPSRHVPEDFERLSEGRDIQLEVGLKSVLAGLLATPVDTIRQLRIDSLRTTWGALDAEDRQMLRELAEDCSAWAHWARRERVERASQAIFAEAAAPAPPAASSNQGNRESTGLAMSAASTASPHCPLKRSWR